MALITNVVSWVRRSFERKLCDLYKFGENEISRCQGRNAGKHGAVSHENLKWQRDSENTGASSSAWRHSRPNRRNERKAGRLVYAAYAMGETK